MPGLDGGRHRNATQISTTQNDTNRKSVSLPHGPCTLLMCMALTLALYVTVVELTRARARSFSGEVYDETGVRFSSARALKHVRKMGVWKREVNTPELDAALDYIRTELEAVVPIAAEHGLVLEVEVFTSSGNFPCSLGQGAPVVISYRDIQSVVARLRPSYTIENIDDALLVNAHVDSAWDGAGVSDNLAGVAIAMELVSAIAEYNPTKHGNRKPVLQRPVVFLFNAAEEPLLAGAHGFMTAHRWSRTIAAHINLESMGAGNAYVLFQLGPNNAWLADAYRRAVRLPWASGAANDLFASGVIPAETDFRIFKEFGIPGYDFALIDNGYVYHTNYDDIDHFSKHAIHSGGKAVFLPLVLELAGSADAIGKFLSNGGVTAAKRSHSMNETRVFQGESATFFDFLGSIFISYRPRYRTALNMGALALLAALFVLERARGVASSSILRLRMAGSYVLSLVAGFAGAVAFAQLLVVLQRPLPWFGSVYSALAVFVPPFILAASWMLERTLPNVLAPTAAVDAMLHAIAVLIAIVLGIAHYIGLGAAYLPLLLLAPFIAGLAGLLPRGPLPLFTVLQTSMMITTAAYVHATLGSLLSVLGRAGTTPSDIVCAVLISVTCSVLFLPAFAPIAASNPKVLYVLRRSAFLSMSVVACVVALRPLRIAGVYSTLAPKRILALHFHAPQADPPSVMALVEFDRIPVDDFNMVAQVYHVSETRKLNDPPVFGTPSSGIDEFVHPLREFFGKWKVYAIGQAPPLDVPTAKVSREVDAENLANVTIVIHARNSMQLSLRLAVDSNIVGWSFEAPLSKQGTWVRHIGRGNGADKVEFSVLVRKNESDVRSPVSLAVSSARRPGAAGVTSAVLHSLHFPNWTAPVQAMVTGATFEL